MNHLLRRTDEKVPLELSVIAFTFLVTITIFHVLHGDMRPSRPRETVSELAAVKVQEAEKPKDVLINSPRPDIA